MVFVARMVGPEEFGKFALVVSTIDTVQVLSGSGLGLAATKFAAEFRSTLKDRVGQVLGILSLTTVLTGSLGAMALYFGADTLSTKVLDDPALSSLLKIGAIALLFGTLNVSQTGALVGFEAFNLAAKVNAISGLVAVSSTTIGVLKSGIKGAIIGYTISCFFNWGVNWFAVRWVARSQGVPFSFKIRKKEIIPILHFVLPSALGDLISIPVNWACRVALAGQPGGAVQYGMFHAAHQTGMLLNQVSIVLGAPLLPAMASVKDAAERKQLTAINLVWYWCAGVLLIFPLLIFPESLGLVFGDYMFNQDAFITTAILAVVTILVAYKRGIANALIANGNMWWSLASNTSWAVVLAATLAVLISHGAVGLASAFAISYIINIIIFLPVYYKTGWVSKEILISMPAAKLWLIIAASLVAVLLFTPLLIRILIFLVLFVLGFKVVLKNINLLRHANT